MEDVHQGALGAGNEDPSCSSPVPNDTPTAARGLLICSQSIQGLPKNQICFLSVPIQTTGGT